MTTKSGWCLSGLRGVLCKTRDSKTCPCGCECHAREGEES